MMNLPQERTQAVKKFGFAPRRAVIALAVLATGCAVAACGSSSAATTKTTASSGSTTSSAGGVNRTAFRTCLQQHGVTLPKRKPGSGPPGSGATGSGGPPAGGGFFGGGGGGGGGQFANPKFRAAIQACGGFRGRFRGGGAGGFRGRISHTAINNFVACVRKHGYPQMPSPNFSGKGGVFPSSIRTNSKFVAASRACASVLVPPRSGGTSTNPGA
jgi:hypothetical protein